MLHALAHSAFPSEMMWLPGRIYTRVIRDLSNKHFPSPFNSSKNPMTLSPETVVVFSAKEFAFAYFDGNRLTSLVKRPPLSFL